jgi:hypothetical protein
MRAVLAGLGMAVCAMSAFVGAHGAVAQQTRPPEPREKLEAFTLCFASTGAALEARWATPERYQMVMEAACLSEEQASLDELEGWLKSWDNGYRDVTAKSVANAKVQMTAGRKQNISAYTLRYELRPPAKP